MESIGSHFVLRTENIKCVTSIIPGNYSISVHDIESDGTVFTSRPAYQTAVRIETLSLSVSFTSSTFSSTLSPSGSSSPFTSVSVTPSSDLTYNNLPIVSISLSITGGVIFVCIILVTVSVILVFCVQHKPKTMTVIKSTNAFHSEATTNIKELIVEDNPSYELVTKVQLDSTNHDEHICGGLSVGDNPCYGMIGRGKHEEENSKL